MESEGDIMMKAYENLDPARRLTHVKSRLEEIKRMSGNLDPDVVEERKSLERELGNLEESVGRGF